MSTRLIKLVVASPSDVQQERDLVERVVKEINEGVAEDRGLQLKLYRWETDTYPGFHKDGPQGLIDSILEIENSDILIGIFWKRFGTPTHDAQSGTEHEFRVAFEAWKQNGRPHIMVYFCQRPYTPRTSQEAEQSVKVLRFKEDFPEEGMYWEYDEPSDFEREVRKHIRNFIKKNFSRLSGLSFPESRVSFPGQPVPDLVANVTRPEAFYPSAGLPEDLRKAESLHEVAVNAHRRGDHDEALDAWTELISLQPDNPNARYNRGNAYSVLGQYENALADFNKAIELDPDFAEAFRNRGATYQRARNYEQALRDYNRAIEISPDYTEAYLNRGQIYGSEERYEEALADFNKGIELDSTSAVLYWFRGSTYLYLEERSEEAIDDFSKALELKPDYAEAYSNRGVAFEQMNQLGKALEDYDDAIKLKPDYSDAHRNRGIALGLEGRIDEALASFRRAIELKPDDAGAYNSRGAVLANEVGRDAEALDDFDKAVEVDPNFAQAHSNRGNVLYALGRYAESIAAHDTAIALQPDAKFYHNRSSSYRLLDRLEEALADANEALSREPAIAEAYLNRGSIYTMLGEYEKALEDFNQGLKLNPGLTGGYGGRGVSLLRLGRYEAARHDFEKAVGLNPYDATRHISLAEASIFTRSYDQALSASEQAQSLSDEPRVRILGNYFKCLALRLSGQDTRETEARLDEALREPVDLDWSFEDVRTWVSHDDLDAPLREYILQITERLEPFGL